VQAGHFEYRCFLHNAIAGRRAGRRPQIAYGHPLLPEQVAGERQADPDDVGRVALEGGLHVLLGDADQALPLIQARAQPPVSQWLDAHASAAVEAMAQRYNLND